MKTPGHPITEQGITISAARASAAFLFAAASDLSRTRAASSCSMMRCEGKGSGRSGQHQQDCGLASAFQKHQTGAGSLPVRGWPSAVDRVSRYDRRGCDAAMLELRSAHARAKRTYAGKTVVLRLVLLDGPGLHAKVVVGRLKISGGRGTSLLPGRPLAMQLLHACLSLQTRQHDPLGTGGGCRLHSELPPHAWTTPRLLPD